jgi:alcohol dehydrogenase class IV
MKLTNRNPVKIVFAQSIAGALKSLLQGRKCWVITTPGMVRRGVFDQIQKETGDLLSGVCSELTANPTFGSVVKCAQKILPAC